MNNGAVLTWHLFKSFVFSGRSGALVRTISWISVLGIGVGVFSLIVVMSVMNGFNLSIRKRFLAVEPHLVVYFSTSTASDASSAKSTLENWQTFQSQLLARRPELQTHHFEQQDVIMRTLDGFFSGGVARGVESRTLDDILYGIAQQKAEGRVIEKREIRLQPGEVMLGIDLARQNGVFEGDELTFTSPESLLLPPGEVPNFETVVVRGFVESSIPEIDGQMVYYETGATMKRLQDTASFRRGVEIRMPNPMAFEELRHEIAQAGFHVESWKDRNSALFAALKLELFAIGLVLALSALIASFSIVTVLILLTTQKRKEIGLLMALGLSPKDTHWVFTKLGMMLSGLGMGGGLVLGTLVSLYIQEYPLDVLPDYYQDTHIPALVNFEFIAFVAVAVLLIAVGAAWLPAKQVSELSPVDALRAKQPH